MKKVILFPLLILLFLCSSCSPKTNAGDNNGDLESTDGDNNEEVIESVDGPGSLDPDRFKNIDDIGEFIEKGGDE